MRVNEIFYSLMGEVNRWGQGVPAIFVRFAGCNLDCMYCDSYDARYSENGNTLTPSEVVKEIHMIKNKSGDTHGTGPVICLTGGEPLIQPPDELTELISLLTTAGYRVAIETNGSKSIKFLNSFTCRENSISVVMDCKLDYQFTALDYQFMVGELSIHPETFQILYPGDWVKIVIESRRDLQMAIEVKNQLVKKHNCKARFAISPVILGFHSETHTPILRYHPRQILTDLLQAGEYDMSINIQLHKFLGVS